MKLSDVITPDELEQELFASDAERRAGLHDEIEAQMSQWRPFADMFHQHIAIGDISSIHFSFWMTLLGAISVVLAEKEKRQVH